MLGNTHPFKSADKLCFSLFLSRNSSPCKAGTKVSGLAHSQGLACVTGVPQMGNGALWHLPFPGALRPVSPAHPGSVSRLVCTHGEEQPPFCLQPECGEGRFLACISVVPELVSQLSNRGLLEQSLSCCHSSLFFPFFFFKAVVVLLRRGTQMLKEHWHFTHVLTSQLLPPLFQVLTSLLIYLRQAPSPCIISTSLTESRKLPLLFLLAL